MTNQTEQGAALAAAKDALELCVGFIDDAHILEAQWGWEPVQTAQAALAKIEALAGSTPEGCTSDGAEPTALDDLEFRYIATCEERDHLRAELSKTQALVESMLKFQQIQAARDDRHDKLAAALASTPAPLTEEQIVMEGLMKVPNTAMNAPDCFEHGVRFAERMHGIAAAAAKDQTP